ncbi:MAG: aldo/keto reductase [Sphingomonadales bacterium]
MTKKITIGPFQVAPIGLGCMTLSHAYGTPPAPEDAASLLHAALDMGYDHLDTAALYGFGKNEALLGAVLADRRGDYMLASKCGMHGIDGKRTIDGRPETLRRSVEDSLQRLNTDVIDLLYLHRWDRKVPIEDSIGAMADLVREGKARALGLSEVSADTLEKAHAVHPIAAVQTEYSLWTRNAEIAVIEKCRALGIAFVAFSPLARGFLTGTLRDVDALPERDIRRTMPRFQGENFQANLKLLDGMKAVAQEAGCTMGQAALAWVLAQGPHITAIPGTTKPDHLSENWAAQDVALSTDHLARLDALINTQTVSGPRYIASTEAETDTEKV